MKLGLCLSGGGTKAFAHIGALKALEEENINLLQNFVQLSEKEKIEIKSLKRGECLMFVGEDHILTKIESSELEKEIIGGKKNEKNNNSNRKS